MKPYLDDGDVVLYAGDCVEVMRGLPEASVDAVVTDPPYGIRFMGKAWDGAEIEAAAKRDRETRNGLGPHSESRPGRAAARTSSAFGPPAAQAGAYDLSPSANRAFQAWCETWAAEALRVLKPGGHLLAFGGTRTYHRLACAIEDAGFEIRDCLVWLYGSGFPKSLDVSKAIDKAAGAEREVVGEGAFAARRPSSRRTRDGGEPGPPLHYGNGHMLTAPATPEAVTWQGWGTALKPGHEPIVMARKPLAERTVAGQVLATGTGALNVDGARITSGPTATIGEWENDANLCASCAAGAAPSAKPSTPETRASSAPRSAALTTNGRAGKLLGDTCRTDTGCSAGQSPEARNGSRSDASSSSTAGSGSSTMAPSPTGSSSTTSTRTRPTTASRTCSSCGALSTTPTTTPVGRWPSNVVLDEAAAALLDAEVGERTSGGPGPNGHVRNAAPGEGIYGGGKGLWQAAGPAGSLYGDTGGPSRFFYTAKASGDEREGSKHPTVKPLALMRWLVRLVTPPGGVVLDCFAGSGTTLRAAREEGFRAIGIEREAEYLADAAHRLRQLSLFS